MRNPLMLKDGVIREEKDHLIITLYLDTCRASVGLSYHQLYYRPKYLANNYIIYNIERLER